MSLFNSNGRLVLLHKGVHGLKKASKYDFVLSPQFYISKREKLPVKYAFQAKKLAPSILEEYLPSEYGYEYIAQKDGDDWVFYAYSPKDLEEFLKNCCNIPASKIGNIYFADQLKPVLKKLPIGIDENSALTLIDNTATIVPRSMLDSDRYAKFTKRLRPKKGFSFKSSRKAKVDKKLSKGAIALVASMALLSLAFFAEGLGYKKALKAERAKLSQTYNDYPELQSKMVRDSIKHKYEKIEKEQRAIRNTIDKLSQFTSKKTLLDTLEFRDNKYAAQFKVDPFETKRAETIATLANLKVQRLNRDLIRIKGDIK